MAVTPDMAVRDLVAGYGETRVLDAVTLDIAPRQLTVLVGPNGSGKSTLLAAMARLMKPTGGIVLLDGKSIHALPTREVAKRLGLLPQHPLVPEGLTVFDLVSRGRYPHQGLLRHWSPADEAAVENALRLTDTLQLADRPVDALSGGQRQRCWIAMALAQETGTILLDEPTSFLDLRYQVEILDLLHSLTRHHGRSVVVVLHDINLAVGYGDKLIFLKEGRVRGTVTERGACTPELIRDVFDIDVQPIRHPETGHTLFVPQYGKQG